MDVSVRKFDKSGIISNIRTHLRHNLVNALKNKDLVQKLGNNAPKSAKQYVHDLLIAEYLWNHNYVYTLSVLTSEAPLLVNFSKYMKPDKNEENPNVQQKLQNDYIVHTLETLGIKPDENRGKDIIKDYYDNDIPLLLCILHSIKKTDISTESSSQAHIKQKNVKHKNVQTKESGEFIYQELSKISLAKKNLICQKGVFDAQLKQKEIELKEQSSYLEKQLLLLQCKLEQAQKIMQAYDIKEKRFDKSKRQENLRIIDKENELIKKEKMLSEEANRLEQEKTNHRLFEDNFKKLQNELSKVKRLKPFVERNCNLSIKDAQSQTDFDSFLLDRNERNFLNQEKQDLSGLVQEQQSRIKQLNARVLYLTRKLEEIQLKYSPQFQVPSSVTKVVNANPILSENSSTEDILRDAKLRLTRLEKESERAEQNYHNFVRNSSK
ncbi:uncharacterized protein LOC131671583 isoform X2 [Phymastichus coffea]|uniref:uncharacterized protein LOC131671583 isoform X2 n=1 Tax=Phymastichus coffea TaxID=108790 RepID=UPI00273B5A5B|nr:uncharacterized protein LOC131671583 isoform X2 [Phymastichus coffea]